MEQGEALGLAERTEAAFADDAEQAGDEPVRAQQGLLRTGGVRVAGIETRIRVLARQGGQRHRDEQIARDKIAEDDADRGPPDTLRHLAQIDFLLAHQHLDRHQERKDQDEQQEKAEHRRPGGEAGGVLDQELGRDLEKAEGRKAGDQGIENHGDAQRQGPLEIEADGTAGHDREHH